MARTSRTTAARQANATRSTDSEATEDATANPAPTANANNTTEATATTTTETPNVGTTANSIQQNVNSASPTPFTISPASAVTGVLNFKVKEHVKVFLSASKRLYHSDQSFDVIESQLHDFIAVLRSRAIKYGWNMGIMTIPMTPLLGKDSPEKKSILESHGSIPIDTIRKFEMTYMNEESRERQDMECLYNCIIASLSSEGRTRVLTERVKFVIKDDAGKEHESGNLLLKVVIDKASVDNYSGAYSIRMELSKLTESLAAFKYNITKFNERVKGLTLSLGKMGMTSDDLPFNLIRAYMTVPVPAFKASIERLREDSEATSEPDRYTDVYIMDRAENRYRSLRKEGSWSIDEKGDDKLLALEVKLKKLEKANRALSKKKSGKTPTKRKATAKLDITRKPGNINKPIVFKGKKFWWCSPETGGKCAGALRRHKPSECKGLSFLKDKNNGEKKKLVAEAAMVNSFDSDSETAMSY